MATEMTAEEVVATMHIGKMADRSQMSLRTIRHYDEVGLLTPSGRTEGGFRLYTERDFSRLMVIRRMKPLGFTLDEMAELLRVVDRLGESESGAEAGVGAGAGEETAAAGGAGEARAALDGFIEQATARRAKLEEQISMADEFIELLKAQ
ncbi:MerR family transcriptional regulator [Frondihabitans sp. VKM Ac-2883]|uniref:MerR family transcriptional regulator n=1 Tax=Frondihabitans sp. VKM Ac-2883 TaxID=2783823 RepID=UPI00188B0463|nr:MerR family transcriptional regulator [Frondihabitans sp. VKM Ac-2883]MBF4576535.1 MerR family transcriptional regulator [Frondihabitans sp. VKM Ac-2883]